jgi:hypothetical protein
LKLIVKKYQVDISPEARQAILEKMIYIANDSVDAAFIWEQRVVDAMQRLSTMPGFAIDEGASR